MYARTCFWHGIEEQVDEKSYKPCATCKHVFQTEAEFRREAFALVTPEYDDNGKPIEGFDKQTWPDDTPSDEILWCPFCGGEFPSTPGSGS
jgi:hypothetical protein